jgi:hypothetical protein
MAALALVVVWLLSVPDRPSDLSRNGLGLQRLHVVVAEKGSGAEGFPGDPPFSR